MNLDGSVEFLQRQKTILRIPTQTWGSLCVQEEKDHQISKLQSFVQLVDVEFDHHTSNFRLTHCLGMNYTSTKKCLCKIKTHGKICCCPVPSMLLFFLGVSNQICLINQVPSVQDYNNSMFSCAISLEPNLRSDCLAICGKRGSVSSCTLQPLPGGGRGP